MGFLGGLLGGSAQASAYDAMKREAWARGRAEKAALEARATGREVAARQNAALDAWNMARMRGRQNEAVGSARAARSGSGFDMGGGSGAALEDAVRVSSDEAIADAALSSSIEQANALNEAVGLRRAGDAAMRAADAEAEQYRAMAKGTRRGLWVSGSLGVAGGVAGAFLGGAAGMLQGADAGFSLGAGVNPFLAKYSDNGWEKQLLGMYNQFNGSK